LQFTDDGKILFYCDNNKKMQNKEDVDECSEYKELEVIDSYTIQNNHFFIRFVKTKSAE